MNATVTPHIDEVLEALRAAVAADMQRKPVTAGDGIYRFDSCISRALETFIPPHEFVVPTLMRAFLQDLQSAAERKLRETGGYRGDWSPLSIVASYAQTQRAWMTPGFAEARRQSNLYGS